MATIWVNNDPSITTRDGTTRETAFETLIDIDGSANDGDIIYQKATNIPYVASSVPTNYTSIISTIGGAIFLTCYPEDEKTGLKPYNDFSNLNAMNGPTQPDIGIGVSLSVRKVNFNYSLNTKDPLNIFFGYDCVYEDVCYSGNAGYTFARTFKLNSDNNHKFYNFHTNYNFDNINPDPFTAVMIGTEFQDSTLILSRDLFMIGIYDSPSILNSCKVLFSNYSGGDIKKLVIGPNNYKNNTFLNRFNKNIGVILEPFYLVDDFEYRSNASNDNIMIGLYNLSVSDESYILNGDTNFPDLINSVEKSGNNYFFFRNAVSNIPSFLETTVPNYNSWNTEELKPNGVDVFSNELGIVDLLINDFFINTGTNEMKANPEFMKLTDKGLSLIGNKSKTNQNRNVGADQTPYLPAQTTTTSFNKELLKKLIKG